MQIKNTETRYGLIAKLLHWVIGLSIIGMLAFGLYIDGLENDDPSRGDMYGLHKAVGLVILGLVSLRVVWFLINFGKPKPLETHTKIEVYAAKSAHIALYVLMVAVPLSGWVMSSAYGFPVELFGYKFSIIDERDLDLAKQAGDLHELTAYVIMGVIGLHILGAVKHVVIDRDDTLKRMTCDCAQKDQDV